MDDIQVIKAMEFVNKVVLTPYYERQKQAQQVRNTMINNGIMFPDHYIPEVLCVDEGVRLPSQVEGDHLEREIENLRPGRSKSKRFFNITSSLSL